MQAFILTFLKYFKIFILSNIQLSICLNDGKPEAAQPLCPAHVLLLYNALQLSCQTSSFSINLLILYTFNRYRHFKQLIITILQYLMCTFTYLLPLIIYNYLNLLESILYCYDITGCNYLVSLI